MTRRPAAQGTPRWVESRQHWRLDVQHGGVRRSFYSSDPGTRKGPAECRRKAAEWMHSQIEDVRFERAWAEFLQDYRQRNKETSARQIESRGKAHLLRRFRLRRLSQITRRDWQQVIYDAHKGGARAERTLRGIASLITAFCRYCVGAGYMEAVPEHLQMPRTTTRGEKSILQPDQIRLLLSPEQDNHYFVPIFRFLMLTGLRRGELPPLQTERDMLDDVIYVRQSLSHEGILDTPKSRDSERSIRLSQLALDQIALHLRHRAEFGIESRYIFSASDGGMLSARSISNQWRRWRAQHGITISLHELRHTMISYTRQRTALSLDELKPIYGHSRQMDTDGTYVHEIAMTDAERAAAAEREREVAALFDQVFREL